MLRQNWQKTKNSLNLNELHKNIVFNIRPQMPLLFTIWFWSLIKAKKSETSGEYMDELIGE